MVASSAAIVRRPLAPVTAVSGDCSLYGGEGGVAAGEEIVDHKDDTGTATALNSDHLEENEGGGFIALIYSSLVETLQEVKNLKAEPKKIFFFKLPFFKKP